MVDVNKPRRYRVGHIVAKRRPRIGYIRQRGRPGDKMDGC
jgi:hypothetical protein